MIPDSDVPLSGKRPAISMEVSNNHPEAEDYDLTEYCIEELMDSARAIERGLQQIAEGKGITLAEFDRQMKAEYPWLNKG